MNDKKINEFSVLVTDKILALLTEGEITPEECTEHWKEFMHSIATVAPMTIYNQFAKEEAKDILEFNHIINRLLIESNK